MKSIIPVIILFFLLFTNIFSKEIKTFSPDGNVEISFNISSNGEPLYSISYKGTRFLDWSKLGLNFKNTGLLNSDLIVISQERKTIDETYRIYSGKSRYSRNYCNEIKISLREKGTKARILDIYLRAYNDGAALRYGIPQQPNISSFVISDEETYFNFSGDYECWAMKKNIFNHSYEGEYRQYNLSTLNNLPGDSTSYFKYVTLPLTMKISSSLYVSLSEANITDYPGTHLTQLDANTLKGVLARDTLYNDVSVTGNTPAVSPWRLFIIGSEPGRLIESNLVMNLNEPCKIADADDWIKPGKTTWSWWAEDRGFDPSFGFQILSTKTVKYYIDFASANNFQYVTLDGGWYGWFDASKLNEQHDLTRSLPELDLPGVVSYAASKGIGIFLWVVWNDLDKQLLTALDYYSSLGIKGIKMDFMERDDQYMTGFYRRVAEECAKRKILINFHGAYKPDGLSRTYPNILTYEAVLGNENAKWITGYPNPKHNVTLPFTRMVAGPMDYTPGSMTNSTEAGFTGQWKNPMTKGTRAQQLAMTVVYESGLLTLCESPKIYEKLPEFDFLKVVPADWDSTLVLEGKIGEYIVVARKKDNNWFIGGMTNSQSRNIRLNMDFLDRINYEAEIYTDSPDADTNPSNVIITKRNITSNETVNIRLAKGGGFAVYLKSLN